MSILFEIKPSHLSNLNTSRSVDLMRDLIFADASISNIETTLINIPYKITVPDGGVDGEVANAAHESRHGIIKKGNTCYQIKSGSFSPSNQAHVDDLLCKKENNGEILLKNRIQTCLEKDGTLVIVLTGFDNPDNTDDFAKNKFLDRLKSIDPKYENAKIEIWRQNTIIGFLQNFPALRLKLLEIRNKSFFFHNEWSRLDDMTLDFHISPEHEKYIQRLQNALHQKNTFAPIRVTGDPGMGKTRIVLEATKTNDLAPLTIYVESPSKLEELSFLNQIITDDMDQFAVLVVDECNPTKQANIWNKLKHHSAKIKLITIFNESTSNKYNDVNFVLPALNDTQIDAILGDYQVPKEQRPKWVEYCKPSPRAAHVIGKNLEQNPDDILKNPDTVNIWDRFIADSTHLDSYEFHKRKIVLLWLSLFKQFGTPFEKESKFIANKIEEQHGIKFGEFTDIIKDLRDRKILQGQDTLYITPKIFHIKMWIEWWERYGPHMAFKLEEIPPMNSDTIGAHTAQQGLRRWYCDMFEYASESPVAISMARDLLGKGGILEQDDMLISELGTGFALILARTDPHITLSFLNRFIGPKSRDDLVKFERGRREAVMALEMTSMKKNLFADSAKLLLALGDAENEDFSNNASGIFKGLFSPASGVLAPTETPPSQRLPIIQDALNSDSKRQRMLAIDACNAALKTEFSMRILSTHNELKNNEVVALWKPKSRDEVIDYYKSVLDIMLTRAVEKLAQDERQKIISVILDNVENMLVIPEIVDCVMDILAKLHKNLNVDNETIIEKITGVIAFRDTYITTETSSKLQKFKDEIIGNDYHSLLKAYAGMYPKSDWVASMTKVRDKHSIDKDGVIKNLARQSLDANLLRPELSWLVTAKAKNGHRFGYLLGLHDAKLSLLSEILQAWIIAKDDSNEFFLSGYFMAIFERDKDEWERRLDFMANDDVLFRAVFEVTRMSGITDRAGRRILHLVKKHDNLNFADILSNFRYGLAANKLSESVFIKWLEFLNDCNDPKAAATSLSLFYGYFVYKSTKQIPKNMTLDILFSKNIICDEHLEKSHHHHYAMQSFDWKETGLRFIEQYPEDCMLIAQKMLNNMTSDSIFGMLRSQTRLVLDHIAELEPNNVCRAALQQIGPPIDSRAFFTTQWLKDVLAFETNAAKIMIDAVFDWTDEDPQKRSVQCANLLPAEFEIARKILRKYGGQTDIQKCLLNNFNTESFSGSASIYYKDKREKFSKLRAHEENVNVANWLDCYISDLTSRERKFTAYEEREYH